MTPLVQVSLTRRKIQLAVVTLAAAAVVGFIAGLLNFSSGLTYAAGAAAIAVILSIGVPWAFGVESEGGTK